MDDILVYNTIYHYSTPDLVSDGAEGAIAVNKNYRNGVNYNLYAQRMDSSEDLLWTINWIPVCTVNSYQGEFILAGDSSGGVIFTRENNYLSHHFKMLHTPGVVRICGPWRWGQPFSENYKAAIAHQFIHSN